ncbi:MAG: 1-acyl-sn-glycerol-3-phosphate acyltransferase [Saprospiraceae bacterium]|nr:1-acyl-sn-glycerol-3-phosphate acyltransferase [Saprospiraceae bacterium]
MKHFVAYARLFFFLSTMAIGILFCMISAVFGGNFIRRNIKIRKAWIRFVAPLMGIRMKQTGFIPDGPCLFISNHRSFLDPVVALYYVSAWPLAKAEISRYPLIGYGTRLTGILFVNRGSMDSRRGAKHAIAQVLSRGEGVLVYAEGTTNTDAKTIELKGGSFKVAMDLGVPIIPIAIEYEDTGDHWGGSSLLTHYIKQVGKRKTACAIAFGPTIHGVDYRDSVQKTKLWMDSQLLEFRQEFDAKLDR